MRFFTPIISLFLCFAWTAQSETLILGSSFDVLPENSLTPVADTGTYWKVQLEKISASDEIRYKVIIAAAQHPFQDNINILQTHLNRPLDLGIWSTYTLFDIQGRLIVITDFDLRKLESGAYFGFISVPDIDTLNRSKLAVHLPPKRTGEGLVVTYVIEFKRWTEQGAAANP